MGFPRCFLIGQDAHIASARMSKVHPWLHVAGQCADEPRPTISISTEALSEVENAGVLLKLNQTHPKKQGPKSF